MYEVLLGLDVKESGPGDIGDMSRAVEVFHSYQFKQPFIITWKNALCWLHYFFFHVNQASSDHLKFEIESKAAP